MDLNFDSDLDFNLSVQTGYSPIRLSDVPDRAHDASKAPVFGDLIGVVKSFVGAPMHAWRLSWKWVEKIGLRPQAG
jgi:hypothetical protein